MQLISLNLWGGALYKPLASFLKGSRSNTDIFCLQEVLDYRNPDAKEPWEGAVPDLYDRIKGILNGFDSS